ncbi:hypothetical protein R6Z07M_001095 [Ovis aries]
MCLMLSRCKLTAGSEDQQLGSARVSRDAAGCGDSPETWAPGRRGGRGPTPRQGPCTIATFHDTVPATPHIGGRDVEYSAGSLLLVSPARPQELEMTALSLLPGEWKRCRIKANLEI